MRAVEFVVDAVGELVEARALVVIDAIDPRRQLRERAAEIARGAAFGLHLGATLRRSAVSSRVRAASMASMRSFRVLTVWARLRLSSALAANRLDCLRVIVKPGRG